MIRHFMYDYNDVPTYYFCYNNSILVQTCSTHSNALLLLLNRCFVESTGQWRDNVYYTLELHLAKRLEDMSTCTWPEWSSVPVSTGLWLVATYSYVYIKYFFRRVNRCVRDFWEYKRQKFMTQMRIKNKWVEGEKIKKS